MVATLDVVVARKSDKQEEAKAYNSTSSRFFILFRSEQDFLYPARAVPVPEMWRAEIALSP